jgi:histidinol-phosphatase
MGYEHEVRIARTAAVAAGEIALRYRMTGFTREDKADLSPVTIADREAERALTTFLLDQCPGDGILGEEGANVPSKTGRKWIIDPIDGTRDYVRGNPFWSVLIGLEVEGEVAAGACYFPVTGEMYSALKGGGAYRNDSPLRTSSVITIGESVLGLNGLSYYDRLPKREQLLEWASKFWSVRSYGGCMDAMMLAMGQLDVWVEPVASPWDLAPIKIIIEEAGGSFFNLDGGSSIYAGNCIGCTMGVEAPVRAFFGINS